MPGGNPNHGNKPTYKWEYPPYKGAQEIHVENLFLRAGLTETLIKDLICTGGSQDLKCKWGRMSLAKEETIVTNCTLANQMAQLKF